jgi:hypothetical protein
MPKRKQSANDENTARIILQVERILAAGERLRTALRAERWIDEAPSGREVSNSTHRWLQTRAESDQAEAAYREAIENCLRSVTDASGHGGCQRKAPGSETHQRSVRLNPIRRMTAEI